ncbi:MAG: hypothetical protein ACJAXL_000661, partial [Alphaproteobacteria bacterium]
GVGHKQELLSSMLFEKNRISVIPVFLRSEKERESYNYTRFPFPHYVRSGMTGRWVLY